MMILPSPGITRKRLLEIALMPFLRPALSGFWFSLPPRELGCISVSYFSLTSCQEGGRKLTQMNTSWTGLFNMLGRILPPFSVYSLSLTKIVFF